MEKCDRCKEEIKGVPFEYVTPNFRATVCGGCINILANNEETDWSWTDVLCGV